MGLKDRFINTLGLPSEVLLKLPLIMMVGGKSLLLENHCGILEYSRERIKVRLEKGEMTLTGKELLIESISDEEIQIKGEILSVSFGGEVTKGD